MTIQADMTTTLRVLAEFERDKMVSNRELAERTGLDPGPLSDAVKMLEDSGYVEVLRTMGSAPFSFTAAWITPNGRYELERATAEAEQRNARVGQPTVRPTPQPVGSPYGFKPEDWEFIDLERRAARLIVVFGHQFKSNYYDSAKLEAAIRREFETALDEAQSELSARLELQFVALRAGYGEHLFNDIARSIIASDIAVFETSDLNPNVMIEMGVALTWGTRVHPIRHITAPKPPSDISGQTWAGYNKDGAEWEEADHYDRVIAMTRLAARRKASFQ